MRLGVDRDGIGLGGLAERLGESFGRLAVVVFSDRDDMESVRDLLRRGAFGVLPERMALGDLRDVLEFIRLDGSTVANVSTTEAPEPAISVGRRVTLEQLETEHIRRVLAETESLDEAASVLGIDRSTLYRKRKRLGL